MHDARRTAEVAACHPSLWMNRLGPGNPSPAVVVHLGKSSVKAKTSGLGYGVGSRASTAGSKGQASNEQLGSGDNDGLRRSALYFTDRVTTKDRLLLKVDNAKVRGRNTQASIEDPSDGLSHQAKV